MLLHFLRWHVCWTGIPALKVHHISCCLSPSPEAMASPPAGRRSPRAITRAGQQFVGARRSPSPQGLSDPGALNSSEKRLLLPRRGCSTFVCSVGKEVLFPRLKNQGPGSLPSVLHCGIERTPSNIWRRAPRVAQERVRASQQTGKRQLRDTMAATAYKNIFLTTPLHAQKRDSAALLRPLARSCCRGTRVALGLYSLSATPSL